MTGVTQPFQEDQAALLRQRLAAGHADVTGIEFGDPGDDGVGEAAAALTAIDGIELFTECALGLPGCGTAKPCPLHDKWADTRDGIREMLENTSLVELAEKGKAENLRITEDGGFEWV